MRMHSLIHALPLLGLLLAGCETPTAQFGRDAAPRSYVLESLDGHPLPARSPCGVFEHRAGRITLGPGRAASYISVLGYLAGGDEVTLVASGTYRPEGQGLLLELRGTWSHQATPGDLRIPVLPDGPALLELNVGSACDARATLRYVPQQQ